MHNLLQIYFITPPASIQINLIYVHRGGLGVNYISPGLVLTQTYAPQAPLICFEVMKEDSNLIAIQINFYPTANLGTEESGRYGEVGV